MPSIWTAVKQMQTDKRFRDAPAPLDALSSVVRQLTKDLMLLRRASKHERDLYTTISGLISHNNKLPSDVDKVAKWCERLVAPFILYIEVYTNTASSAPASLQSLRRAPFAFLEEAKELLTQLESLVSKPCGVSAISALAVASRRMLTIQSSQESNDLFEFSRVRSFRSNRGVSAAFNPLDVAERALFDISVDGGEEQVAEVLLLQRHGRQSLAICSVHEKGVRSLKYPPFKGGEFSSLSYPASDTMALSTSQKTLRLSATEVVVERWKPIFETLFRTRDFSNEDMAKIRPARVSGLGIALVPAEPAPQQEEKFGEDYDEFEEEPEPVDPAEQRRRSRMTTSESLNVLKRISVGMPVDFSDDLAKILRGIEEEDSALEKAHAKKPIVNTPAPAIKPKVTQPPTSSSFVNLPATQNSSTSNLLPNPTAPFNRGSVNSPGSFFSAHSPAFSSSTPGSLRTPDSLFRSSPRTLDEAEKVRRRISTTLRAREQDEIKERYRTASIVIDEDDEDPSSRDVSTEVSFKSLSESSGSSNSSNDLRQDLPVFGKSPMGRKPPAIPPPDFPEGVTVAKKATVVHVSIPKRINFVSEGSDVKASPAADLSVVPISPVVTVQGTPEISQMELKDSDEEYEEETKSMLDIKKMESIKSTQHTTAMPVATSVPKMKNTPTVETAPNTMNHPGSRAASRSNTDLSNGLSKPEIMPSSTPSATPTSNGAPESTSKSSDTTQTPPLLSEFPLPTAPPPPLPQVPRAAARKVFSLYSPKPESEAETAFLPRSHSDDNDVANTAVTQAAPSPQIKPQPEIWYTDASTSKTKLKNGFTKLFRKKPKTQRADLDVPSILGNGSSVSVATLIPPPVNRSNRPDIMLTPEASPMTEVDIEESSQPAGHSEHDEDDARSEDAFDTHAMPTSSSLQSIASHSEPDLRLRKRASTVFFQSHEKSNAQDNSSASTEATAVCVDSNNRTVASSSASTMFSSNGSLSSAALNSSQSYASMQSRGTTSTANTSLGSTEAWSDWINNVKDGAQKHLHQKDQARLARIQAKTRELEKMEEEVRKQKATIEETERKLRDATDMGGSTPTLDPGNLAGVNRSIPAIRKLYEEKERTQDSKPVNSVYSNQSATFSAPVLGVSKPQSVSFAPSASSGTTTFTGCMWVSKWTVNRWVPLSQNELLVQVSVSSLKDLLIVHIPGSDTLKLKFTSKCDVRWSNAHDVEVKIMDEVYMFRTRSTVRSQKFFYAVESLQIDFQDPATYPRKITESDSSSGSSGSSGSSATRRNRTMVPPQLSSKSTKTRKTLTTMPIVEETF